MLIIFEIDFNTQKKPKWSFIIYRYLFILLILTSLSQLNIFHDFKMINLKKILNNKTFFIEWFKNHYININFDNFAKLFLKLL